MKYSAAVINENRQLHTLILYGSKRLETTQFIKVSFFAISGPSPNDAYITVILHLFKRRKTFVLEVKMAGSLGDTFQI